MKGINRQYQALRGARFARIPLLDAHRPTVADSFLPPDSPAGKQAAPEVLPLASGAAVAIGVDMAADLTGICIRVPANVAMFFELLRTEQGLSPDEIFARGVCLVADRIGIAALAREITPEGRGRHANSRDPGLHFVDGCLVDLPDFPRTARNRMGATAR